MSNDFSLNHEDWSGLRIVNRSFIQKEKYTSTTGTLTYKICRKYELIKIFYLLWMHKLKFLIMQKETFWLKIMHFITLKNHHAQLCNHIVKQTHKQLYDILVYYIDKIT